MRLDDISLVMLAAGASTRFRAITPTHPQGIKLKKQWLRSGVTPLWLLATRNITKHFSFAKVLIAASSEDYHYMRLVSPYPVIKGGESRAQSLQNALNAIDTPLVLVSDVARWDCQKSVIEALIQSLDNDSACAVPYINVADTSFYGADSKQGAYLKREDLKLIQTPQLSRVSDLKAALKPHHSDESSALHDNGKKIAFVRGSRRMQKITHIEDLNFLPLTPANDSVVIGQGADIHRFEKGKKMRLCGVDIECDYGFKAHSDGDIVLHALSDAILGAIGGGDIGEWFPDSNAEYKGADSVNLLKHIYDFAQSVGYEMINVDMSIITQMPKIAPYKLAMRENLAKILSLSKERVNIKATTSENLGFIGRLEGAYAEAVVSMRLFDWHKLCYAKGDKYQQYTKQVCDEKSRLLNTDSKEGEQYESINY